MTSFKKYLDTVRKRNGDELLDSTKEFYLSTIEKYKGTINQASNKEELLDTCNFLINRAGNNATHAAFVAYLKYLGYPKEDLEKLAKPKSQSSALASKRFLQSKVLSREELRKLINEIDDLMLKFAVSLTYDTACRRNEVLSIRVKDIERPNDEDISKGVMAKIMVLGKGAKRRQVYMRKTSFDLFEKVYKEYGYDKESNLICFKSKKGVVYKNQAQAFYDKLSKKGAEILKRPVHPHMLRHTQATHMADNDCDTRYIASYLGHEDITITQIYIEISNATGKKAFLNYTQDISEV